LKKDEKIKDFSRQLANYYSGDISCSWHFGDVIALFGKLQMAHTFPFDAVFCAVGGKSEKA
jgi:hypothetical protein